MFHGCRRGRRWDASCGGRPFAGEEYGSEFGPSVRPLPGTAGDLSWPVGVVAVLPTLLVFSWVTHLSRSIVLTHPIGNFDEN